MIRRGRVLRTETAMRNMPRALACLLVGVLLIAGCYESLTDIATPDKAVFFGDLVGDYAAVHPATGGLTLKKGTDTSYAYTQYDDKGAPVNRGTFWILKLGDETFYQVSADGYATADGRPVYAIGRLRVEGEPGAKTLTGYAFKSPETFFGDRLVTTAEYERLEGGERKTGRAVSMPPEKLQTYLAVRAAEMTEPTLKFQQKAKGR